MPLTVYQTDPEGLLCLPPIEADPDPLEEGNYLIPSGCVYAVPPVVTVNEIQRWHNGAWEIIPDFRGARYWLADRSEHTITQVGITLPADALSVQPPAPVITPTVVSMRQARLALLGAGLLTTVNAAVAAMSGVDGDAARIEWEFSPIVKRESPFVSALSASLGLSSAQLDTLITAATL